MTQSRAAGAPRLAAPPRRPAAPPRRSAAPPLRTAALLPRPQRAAALLAALALARCGGAPPRPAPAEGRAPAATPPPPPDEPPSARWVDASGATAIGPRVAGGTVALLGGRRFLVGSDGAARPETAACPEPLLELALVPSAAGARLVGRGVHGVYRFEDPLGAPAILARSEAELLRIGGGPGVVAVWDAASDLPTFLDVETGQPRALPGLPALPLRAVAFRDLQQGAGLFEAAGLAVTSDGGASWRPVAAAPGGDGQAAGAAALLRFTDLRLRGDDLLALAQGASLPAEQREARILVAEARLAPAPAAPAPAPPAPGDPGAGAGAPLLRWIQATGRHPIEAAIASGARGAGFAVAASHGLLARVDLATGALIELAPFGRGAWVNACGAGRAGRSAWVACALGDEAPARRDLHDPFGVLHVPLAGGRLGGEPPAVLRSGEAELRVSPSGGAMLLAPCAADEEGSACVRQPGGRWITVRPGTDIHWRGAGPLADGRIAIVRGLWDSDVVLREAPAPGEAAAPTPRAGAGRGGPAPGEAAAPTPRASAGRGGPAPGAHIAVIDARGREQPLIPLGWLRDEDGDIHVVSPIEEGPDGALSFVVADEAGELTAVVAPRAGQVSRTRLAGAARAVIHAGHGVAVGEGRVLASADAGRSWAPVDVPASAARALVGLDGLLDEPGVLAVNDVGLKIDAHLRVGWGPASPVDGGAPAGGPALEAAPLLPHRPPPAPALPERALACTTLPGPPAGRAQGALGLGAGSARPGEPRHASSVNDRRSGRLSMGAALEVHAPGGAAGSAGRAGRRGVHAGGGAAARAAWTLRWLDPAELQGTVRSWTGPAPEGAGDATLARFAASGDRVVFGVRAAGRDLLVRARHGRGAAEVAEVPLELMPEAEIAFSEAPDGPIAWIRDGLLVVWSSGEAPRPIAALAGAGAHALGQPTSAGVPLLLSFRDLALARTVPIPPAEEAAPGALEKAPPLVPLDGWEVAPNLRTELTRLPACAARPRGARFLVHRMSAFATVDGHGAIASAAVYDVRVSGRDACVAKIAALIDRDHRGEAWSGAGLPALVRADLAARRAEIGELGNGEGAGRPGGTAGGAAPGTAPAATRSTARRLACSLHVRP
ncbi:hypothetical protein [Sorangium sp. So ce1097]|uniref:hypothetical protein n=1 Tax=Sorangium sp. So ce1097 TaxID=3133330 RepID=UPI003F646C2A